ncbi:hypothetical protein SCH01S_10_00480 [Sphingomonas changbaiensis NBRC 104936]|uniref:Lipoprotein n=1 Tax=Sphingomonas changbaiensis NBRC 104936 TaxID=1219043 RepID=A0A0E9ML49_9SPHN|nr:hypothetical protein [Sphingomonas changbaiensis]GAO38238.1 hypothetical protein SCH01S_10_00480 [Sphingomonas changbaiensis NBRC 104936]
MKRLVALFLLFLAACSQQAMIDRIASRDEQAQVLTIAQELRDGRSSDIEAEVQPQLRSEVPETIEQIRRMLAVVPGPFSIDSVNSVSATNRPTTKTFLLHAGAGDHWAVIDITLQGVPGTMELAGFHVQRVTADPTLNQFRWADRGVFGYIWLAIMAACPLTCLWAVVLIWRRRWLDHRWLWTIGSLLGYVGFGLNWATGAWAILFVNVSVLGAQALKMGPYGPWLLNFGIPVVAIIVIVRWYRRGKTSLIQG